MHSRALSSLPLPVRLAITLPMAAMMIAINAMAWSNQRSFDTWREEERSRSHHRVVHDELMELHPSPARHDPTAFYPSEHVEPPESDGGLQVLTAVTAASVAGSVLAGAFGLYVLFGGATRNEEELT